MTRSPPPPTLRRPRLVEVIAIERRTIDKHGQRHGRCPRVYVTIRFPNYKTARLIVDEATAVCLLDRC